MAKSLIEKLNLLVRSSVTDFLAEVGERLPDLPLRQRRELDFEVGALRKRVNEALAYEERLEAQLTKVLDEVEQADLAADDAIAAGDEARARVLVQRLKRMQQQAAMLEHQLQEHRMATADLIAQVNYLDSLVADIQHEREAAEEPESAHRRVPPSPPPPSVTERLSRPTPARAKPTEPLRQAEEPRRSTTVRIPVAVDDEDVAPGERAPAQPAAESEAASSEAPAQSERYRLSPETARAAEAAAEQQVGAEEEPQLPEVKRLTEALRKARINAEKAERNIDEAQAWKAEAEGRQPPWPHIPDEGPSKDEVDADIAARRSRLAKPE